MTRPSLRRFLRASILTAGLIVAATSVTKAGVNDFTVYNQGSGTIEYLYVEPSGYAYWGSDLLGSYEINPGYNYHPLVGWKVPNCVQDVKAVYTDGHIEYYWGINVCNQNLTFYY